MDSLVLAFPGFSRTIHRLNLVNVAPFISGPSPVRTESHKRLHGQRPDSSLQPLLQPSRLLAASQAGYGGMAFMSVSPDRGTAAAQQGLVMFSETPSR